MGAGQLAELRKMDSFQGSPNSAKFANAIAGWVKLGKEAFDVL